MAIASEASKPQTSSIQPQTETKKRVLRKIQTFKSAQTDKEAIQRKNIQKELILNQLLYSILL